MMKNSKFLLTINVFIAFFSQQVISVVADSEDGHMNDSMMSFFDQNYFWIFMILIILFTVVAIAYVVAQDAYSKGDNGLFWFFVVIFMPMMGLFLYLAYRLAHRTSFRNQTLMDQNVNNRSNKVVKTTIPLRKQTFPPSQKNTEEVQYCTNCGQVTHITNTYCQSCGEEIYSH